MVRILSVLAGLLVIGGVAVFCDFSANDKSDIRADTNDSTTALRSAVADGVGIAANGAASTLDAQVDNEREAPSVRGGQPSMSEMLAKWVADTTSDDAAKRAAAIDELATAPQSQAIPILQKVLGEGLEEDRQLALKALRSLALNQGDTAGEIRNLLRQAIYDSYDEAVAVTAQTVLDDIEHEASQVSSPHR